MPLGFSDIVALSAILGTFTVTVALWHRRWLGMAIVTLIVVSSWILLIWTNEADIQREMNLIQARMDSGEEISLSDQLYDGVGDRVAVLLFGWLPAGIGLVSGIAAAYGMNFSKANQ